jgi:hypothetical protein
VGGFDSNDPFLFLGLNAFEWGDATMAAVGRLWAERRDGFLEEWLSHEHNLGRRPWAFWEFDLQEEPPDVGRVTEAAQTRRLAELGLLGAEERRRLLAEGSAPDAPPYLRARAEAVRSA